MAGIRHHPLADISDIRSLLDEQYHPSAIIKELVQNADDARAERLFLAVHPGLPTGCHPLLRSPSLLVLNDGVFRENDAHAIPYKGLGSKGNDRATIGKFGRGLKSVFHLCEAFFYVASPHQEGMHSPDYDPILNPWETSGFHPEWEGIEKADLVSELQSAVNAWTHGLTNWFCLWIPLRTRTMLNGKAAIQDAYPKPEEFLDPSFSRRIAILLPLMRSLHTVAVWEPAKTTGWHRAYTVHRTEDSSRSRFRLGDLAQGAENAFSGRAIYTGRAEGNWEYQFYARERLAHNERLLNIRQSPDWPKAPTFDRETGAPIMDPDKAEQHAAVVFGVMSDMTLSNVPLVAANAVFLPLSGQETEAHPFDAMFTLLLHGYFFVDAGRRELVRQETGNSEKIVCASWNRVLEERVQHSLILPTLSGFVAAFSLDAARVESLTRAIEETSLYKEHRETLCEEHNWLCEISLAATRWSLSSATDAYWELPAVPITMNGPWDVLPGLLAFIDTKKVVFCGMPRLSLGEPMSWQPYLAELLANIPVRDVFTRPEHLSYLVRFLEEANATTDCAETLLALVRSAFAICTLEDLRTNIEALQTLLRLLPPSRLIAIRSDIMQALGTEEAMRHLSAIQTHALLIPQELMREGMAASRLSLPDGRKLFAWLEKASLDPRLRSSAAIYFLNLMTGNPEEKRQFCGDLAVFLGFDYRQNKRMALCWNKVRELRANGCLVSRRLNMARPLQDTLAADTVIAIQEEGREVSEALFGSDLPPICDENFCFAFLRRCPALEAHSGKRIGLVKMLRQREDHPDYRRLLRYLLHGQSAHFEDVADPLLSEDLRHVDAFWGRIVHHVLRQTDSEWCYVASDLLEELTSRQRSLLGIATANETIAEELLLEHGATSLTGCPLSRSECMSLLTAVKDDVLWAQLPFHETVAGIGVSLSDQQPTFFQSSTAMPEALQADVTLLATPLPNALYDRYRRLGVKEWSSWGVLQVALDKPAPVTYWRELIGALGGVGKGILGAPDVREHLRTTSWLPRRASSCRAHDVLCLPAINAELDRLMALPELSGTFYTEDGFLPEFREHPVYPLVQEFLLPDLSESFAILTTCLDGVSAYYIGDLAELAENLGRWAELLRAFDGANNEFLPGIALLRSIERAEAYRPYIPELMSPILKSLPTAIVLRVLEELRKVYTADKGLSIYNMYLAALVRGAGGQSEILRAVPLRNRSGHWKSASELCMAQPGVHPADTLDAGQERILRPLIASLPSDQPFDDGASVIDDTRSSTAGTLKTYFASWHGLVPREVIGGFLALWGDENDVLKLAQEYLGHRWKVATFREALHWTTLTGNITGAGEGVHEATGRQRFLVSQQKVGQDRFPVSNLLGEWFHARVASDVDTLFLGRFEDARMANHRGTRVCLRQFDPTSYGRRQLVELLRDTTSLLLEKTYLQWPDNLESLWNDLNDSEQVDLTVAQEMILDNAFFYFGLLDTSHQQRVRELRREWDNLRFDAVQERRLGAGRTFYAAEEEKDALRTKLRTLLEEDNSFQEEILRSVCGKVEQSQYEPVSVPFELFQNADDATVERREMEPAALGIERMVLRLDAGLLQWMHWGRAINASRSQKLSSADGRERGYHLDLCKMLTLSSSDKAGQETNVTGKFGLGFKSVFLLSQQPRIVSGDLGFSVVAGMYPRRLDEPSLTALQQVLKDYSGDDVRSATIIELETRQGIDAETVVSAFARTVHVLVAFARSIRQIEMVSQSKSEVIAWSEWSVAGVKFAFTGELTPTRRSGLAPTRALLLRPQSPVKGALLLSMDAYGFVPFPEELPTCWVTTPARSGQKGLGIAVNAPFQVDIGRAQLAETPQNETVAQGMSEGLASILADLYTASTEWERFGHTLHLAADADPYRFWGSLWHVATRACLLGTGVEGKVVRSVLVHRGLTRLWQEYQTVPTGLDQKFYCLTSLSRVRFVAVGILDEDPKLFACVAVWPSVAVLCNPGEVISGMRVAVTAHRLEMLHDLQELTLMTVLKQEQPSSTGDVTPDEALRLSSVLTRERLDSLLREDRLSTEGAELSGWLQKRCFLSEAGTYRSGTEILISSSRPDDATEEALRAAFAPTDRLLSLRYAPETHPFFRLCRDRMDAPAELLKEWGQHAVGGAARLAFLRYLLRGELSARITVTMAERNNSWLQNSQLAEYRTHFRDEEWTQLLGKLGHSLLAQDDSNSNDENRDESRRILPLETVWRWWSEHRASKMPTYEARLYPEGTRFLAAIGPEYRATLEEREAWLGLLLRSSLESMGRSRHDQHRQFLRIAQEQQWLRVLAEDPTSGDRFFQQIREYVGGQFQFLEYFQWMKQFLGISVFAAWIDEYAEAILSVNQMSGPIVPNHLFNPRINPLFQRGGPDAPPLQGVLGIGACFLLRELVRVGAVTNTSVYPYCFVPSRRVRVFLDYCGIHVPGPLDLARLDQSALIYEQIGSLLGDRDATFGLTFDIPFEIIAADPRIWGELLEVDYVSIPEEEEA